MYMIFKVQFFYLFQDVYSTISKTIRSSNQMPSGYARETFKTFTDFYVVTSKMSNNIISQSNQIISTDLPAVKLKK